MDSNSASRKWAWNAHLGWIIFHLSLVIVCLLVVNWGRYPNLVDRINFAATITSLVVGVLAIVYAFLSGDSVANAVNQLNNAAEKIHSNTEKLDGALHNLTAVVQEIPAKLDSFSSTLNRMAAAQSGQSTNQPAAKVAPDFAATFCRVSSMNGLKVLLACALAHAKQKQVDLRALCQADGRMSYDYAYGFLIAAVSTGLLLVPMPANGSESFSVNLVSDHLLDVVNKAIEDRIGFLRINSAALEADEFGKDVEKVRMRYQS